MTNTYSELATYLQCICMLSDARLSHLFLALFEPSEVVLYEECGVELADRHVIFLRCSCITKHTHILRCFYVTK